MINKKELALKYLWHYLGTFYSWGGDDPSSFDCSGLISEIAQAVGIIGRGERLTAQMFWDRFLLKRVPEPYASCLVFWHSADNPDRIIHIEMCIDELHAIGASGGGSKTITKEDAIRMNAFVKIRPWQSRKNVKGFIDPFLEEAKFTPPNYDKVYREGMEILEKDARGY